MINTSSSQPQYQAHATTYFEALATAEESQDRYNIYYLHII